MKIARIAPLKYTPGKCEYFSFIRGGVGADYHQGPVFFEPADGSLMLCWGAYDFQECSRNAVTLYSVSKDQGITWSDPQVFAADYPAGSPGYPHMLRLRDSFEALMLTTRTVHHIEVDEERRVAVKGSNYLKSRTRVMLRRSHDGGQTFEYGTELPYQTISGGKELAEVGFYGAVDGLLQLESGRVLAFFTFIDPERLDPGSRLHHHTSVCIYSDDGGTTWTRGAEIVTEVERGTMEPRIAEIAPNQLLCLCRTKGGFLYQTRSEDGGATWQTPTEPSPLTAPESMAQLLKLQSGSLLAVWNNVSSTTPHPRHPLVAALSGDGGTTWTEPRVIQIECGTNQLSNHGVVQLEDGRILSAISHYRHTRPMASDLDVALYDEAWVRNG